MSCTVEWNQDGSTVRVVIRGAIDAGTSRRVSGAIASHVGIDDVAVVEVDTSEADVVEPAGTRVFDELERRFSGAGQRFVLTHEARGGDRAAALR